MKKIIIGIFVLSLTFVCGLKLFESLDKPTDVFISPTEKYKVELYGNKERPWLPLSENLITAKIYVEDKPFASAKVHSSYWLESSFEQYYQKYVWVDDNILSFRGLQNQEVASSENGDSLLITNKSEKRIQFLTVSFGVNLFLILDLPPETSQKVFINHSIAPAYIYAKGEFSDGQIIKSEGVNFPEKFKKKSGGLFKYCLSVEDKNILINSFQIEGYTNSDKFIPKSEICN